MTAGHSGKPLSARLRLASAAAHPATRPEVG